MRAWMLFLLLVCTLNIAHAKEFTAKVIAVLDGDTVLVLREGGGAAAGHPPASPLRGRRHGVIKIRLAEIDAPEVGHAGLGGQPPNSQKAQTFGETSKRSLSDMVLGKQVQIASQTVDKYGRMVAHLSVNGLDVNAEQIRRGMAWEYSNFHSNHALIALQEEAKKAPRGLWAQGNPTPPWAWRKQHPSTFSAPSKAAALPVAAHTTSPDPTCGNKKHCSEMVACAEAKHDFSQCGVKALDGDRDGTPCENLCGDKKQ